MPKKKKVKIKPDLSPTAKGIVLMLEGWNRWEEGTTAHQRGQVDLYLENKGLEEIPERFKEDSVRARQFNYTPQQKRGGKIPKEVLPDE